MGVWPACMTCNTCVSDAYRDQKRWLDLLELELQRVWGITWVLELNPSPLEEDPMPLTIEPSLQHWRGFVGEKEYQQVMEEGEANKGLKIATYNDTYEKMLQDNPLLFILTKT